MKFETFIALRYLRSPRKDRSISFITFISVTGVSLGVMALIVVLSVMNGFERDLKNALIGANSHLTMLHYQIGNTGIDNYEEVIPDIKETIKTKAVVPFIMKQSLIMGTEKPRGALVKGIHPKMELDASNMNAFIKTEFFTDDKLDPETKEIQKKRAIEVLSQLTPKLEEVQDKRGKFRKVSVPGIILGTQMAQQLGVSIGHFVTLVSPEERITPMGNLPRAKRFKVVGYFESGLAGYDEVLAFIHIKQAQKIFRMGKKVTGITINIDDPNDAEEVKLRLREKFPFPYMIKTWIEENRNLFAVIQLEKLGLAVILTFIILVAAFNIISTIVMLVIEKRKDIAILKSMGAKDSSIRKIFVMQGIVIGLLGTIIGELGGLAICWVIKNYQIIDIPRGVYPSNSIPMAVEIWQLSIIAVVSFVICFLVTVIPSNKAAKIDPVEGLRYE